MTMRDTLIDTLVEETSGETFLAVTVYEIVESIWAYKGHSFSLAGCHYHTYLSQLPTLKLEHLKTSAERCFLKQQKWIIAWKNIWIVDVVTDWGQFNGWHKRQWLSSLRDKNGMYVFFSNRKNICFWLGKTKGKITDKCVTFLNQTTTKMNNFEPPVKQRLVLCIVY